MMNRPSYLSAYIPGMDGLRAMAVLAVFVHQIVDPVIPGTILWWGWTGVDLFFVISGFLITGILYDTLEHTHYFRNFYIRRTLRIFPLFYGVWLILFLASIAYPVDWNRYLLAGALYMVNIFGPGATLHHHAQSLVVVFHRREPGRIFSINIAHLWSLSLEAQFYLVWPLVIWLVRKRKALMIVCGVAVVCVPLLRTYIYLHSTLDQRMAEAIIIEPYARFDTLLMGGWLALWLRSPSAPSLATVKKVSHFLIGVPLALMLFAHLTIGLRWPITIYHPMVGTCDLTFIGLIAGGLVLACLDPTSLIARTMQQRPLLHLGRISYGFYVFHYLFFWQILLLEQKLMPRNLEFLGPLVAFCGTYVLARLSYQYFESPILKLKAKFTEKDHPTAPLTLTPV